MARKNYSDEFRRQAVELYESTPGATMKGIARDLGIERNTLRFWIDQLGSGTTTAADGTPTPSPRSAQAAARNQTGQQNGQPDPAETTEQRLARLEAENAALRAEKAKLVTEREILRSAAKYFAGETNW
jgi:transposase